MQNLTSSKISNLKKLSLGLAACGAVVVTAYAAVTFNSATGSGFVGKGDLQTPWGWNDPTLQANAAGIEFYYATSSTSSYSAVCEFTTGEGTRGQRTHEVTHRQDVVAAVNSAVAYEARKNSQGKVTGFNLTGFGATTTTSSGSVPVVGGPCPGNEGHDGVWTSVTLLSASSTGGGLFATSPAAPAGTSPLLIWSAP
jgi:hypothetical protein